MKIIFASVGMATLAMAASPAWAEGPYVRFETGVTILELPSNLFFANRGTTSPFTRFDNLDTDDGVLSGVGLNLAIGAELPSSVLGSDHSTIEFSGAYHDVRGDTSASFFDQGAGVRYGWVELNNSSGLGTPDGATLATTTNRSAQYGLAEVLLKNRYGKFELFFGPEFRDLNQRLTITGEISTSVDLTEKLHTTYGGATLGASMDVVDDGDWLVNILGGVSVLDAETTYDANYADSSFVNLTARLNDRQVALGAEAKITVEKQVASNTTLGGFVAVDYLSYSPQVNYGSVSTDTANGVLRLEGASAIGASVGLTVKHRF